MKTGDTGDPGIPGSISEVVPEGEVADGTLVMCTGDIASAHHQRPVLNTASQEDAPGDGAAQPTRPHRPRATITPLPRDARHIPLPRPVPNVTV